MDNNESLLSKTVKVVRSIVYSSPYGITINKLQRDFIETEGHPLPYGRMGYSSVETFLRSLPDTFSVTRTDQGLLVSAFSTEKSKHIDLLVAQQSKPKAKGRVRRQPPPPRVVMPEKRTPPPSKPTEMAQSHKAGLLNYPPSILPLMHPSNTVSNPFLTNYQPQPMLFPFPHMYQPQQQPINSFPNNHRQQHQYSIAMERLQNLSFSPLNHPPVNRNMDGRQTNPFQLDHHHVNGYGPWMQPPMPNNGPQYGSYNGQFSRWTPATPNNGPQFNSFNGRSDKPTTFNNRLSFKSFNGEIQNNSPTVPVPVPVPVPIAKPAIVENNQQNVLPVDEIISISDESLGNTEPNRNPGQSERLYTIEGPFPSSDTSSSQHNPFEKDLKECSTDDALPNFVEDDFVFSVDYPNNVMSCNDKLTPAILKGDVQPGNIFVIYVTEVNSPSKFWFNFDSTAEGLDKLMNDLDSYYSSISVNELLIKPSNIRPGQICASLFSNMWHRAEIISNIVDNKVKVCYVDYGTVSTVSVSSIKYLLKDFADLPSQAYRGCLDHIKPLSHRWSRRDTFAFLSMISDIALYAKVTRVNRAGNYMKCILIDTHGASADIVINKTLIEKGYGVAVDSEDDSIDNGAQPLSFHELHPTFEMLEQGLYPSFSEIGYQLSQGIDFISHEDSNIIENIEHTYIPTYHKIIVNPLCADVPYPVNQNIQVGPFNKIVNDNRNGQYRLDNNLPMPTNETTNCIPNTNLFYEHIQNLPNASSSSSSIREIQQTNGISNNHLNNINLPSNGTTPRQIPVDIHSQAFATSIFSSKNPFSPNFTG